MVRTSVFALFALGCAAPTPAPPAPAPAPKLAPAAGVARTWRPLASPAPFAASEPLLLTDGRLFVKELDSERWWSLTPDDHGSYEHGTWDLRGALPAGYIPLYFASAVLSDGRVIIVGGEYDNSADPNESKRAAIYDPMTDQWTEIKGPRDWPQIGDAQGIVLADNTFMLGNCCNSQQALLDATNLTWTLVGSGKADANSEESWALLPDGRVLTVDLTNSSTPGNTELYDPKTGAWSSAGDTPTYLSDSNFECGPLVLRPDGTVLAVGDNGHTAVYDSKVGTWATAPDLPAVAAGQLDSADGPGAALPNGNVLLVVSPGAYNPPSTILEWDGKSFNSTGQTPNCVDDPSYVAMMILLPTGEVLMTDFTQDVELYTPDPGVVDGTAPEITGIADAAGDRVFGGETGVIQLYRGRTYTLDGIRLNGVTQGAYYGDDDQANTNYPLVRGTVGETVKYFRTHDHSSAAIGADVESSTQFDIPLDAPRGTATLEVVTNGIASPAIAVEIK